MEFHRVHQFYSPGGYLYKLDSNIIIPYVSAVVNKTFYWSITLADGSIINSSSHNQTILNLQVDNCSNYTTKLFNYTIVDEENQNNLTNTTLELYLRILAYGTTQEILNYTYSYNNTNPALVCLNLNLTNNSQYSVISTVKYQADDHAIEYYNVDNFTLQNSTIPQNITLYDLNSSKSIDFQVSFKDNYFLPVEGALIHIIRQYIPEGTFKTVEIPKTDTNGQTVAHLVRNDVVYNILVTKGNDVLGQFNNIIAFCQDIAIGDCRINLNAVSQGDAIYDYNESLGIAYNLDYNESTRTITLDFSTLDGSTRKVDLIATTLDYLGNSTPCNETLTSSTGTITCIVPMAVGDATLFLDVYVSGQSLVYSTIIRIGETLFFGTNGYFLLFFLVLSFALMFSGSKSGTIIGVIIGFVASAALGLVKQGAVGIGSAIIWLIIAGFILLWRLNREGST